MPFSKTVALSASITNFLQNGNNVHNHCGFEGIGKHVAAFLCCAPFKPYSQRCATCLNACIWRAANPQGLNDVNLFVELLTIHREITYGKALVIAFYYDNVEALQSLPRVPRFRELRRFDSVLCSEQRSPKCTEYVCTKLYGTCEPLFTDDEHDEHDKHDEHDEHDEEETPPLRKRARYA